MAVLRNKTVLVTGASRGIGRTTASALAEAGAHVLVYYGRSVQDAESLVADIRSNEGRADAIRADLGTPEGATLLPKEVSSIVGERLDVLVSNAGISRAYHRSRLGYFGYASSAVPREPGLGKAIHAPSPRAPATGLPLEYVCDRRTCKHFPQGALRRGSERRSGYQ